jgi:hypothetical protein
MDLNLVIILVMNLISFIPAVFFIIQICINYPKKDLRDGDLARTFWLNSKELPRYMKFISLLFDIKGVFPRNRNVNFRKLVRPIIKMWNLSGITFTIKYYSEVLRLCICYLDIKNRYSFDRSTWVKTHGSRITSKQRKLYSFSGLPACLPIEFKNLLQRVRVGIYNGSLSRYDLVLVKLLFSALSFFRCSSPKYAPTKISTITGNFTGESRTLDRNILIQAINSMGLTEGMFRSKASIINFSTKAGPNAPLAVLGLGIDLIAWMQNPAKWVEYVRLSYSRRYYSVLFFFVFCSFLLLPILVLVNFSNGNPSLGRIAILEEARGKRRLIGITDWWTQVLLRPLHDDIYAALGTIPQDGTNNQSLPIKLMLSQLKVGAQHKKGSMRIQSMDLSAATDRLPVHLQAQILNLLGFDGDLWMKVLARKWSITVDGVPMSVEYAVGQPMGAYSSFAMLALTHHIIVRYSSIKAGYSVDKLIYAVLGDDGAMANEQVARVYKQTFSVLGMDINPIKGFDGNVLEFAKQLWTVNKYNLSPLGAKNILLAIRHVEFLPSVIYEIFVKLFPIHIRSNSNRTFERTIVGASFGYHNKRNWKRSGVPVYKHLFSFDSLIVLVSSLFFRNDKKVENKNNNNYLSVAIAVLMAIGPRSGLWYLSYPTISYLYGRHSEMFMDMFVDNLIKIFKPNLLIGVPDEVHKELSQQNPIKVDSSLLLYRIRLLDSRKIKIIPNLLTSFGKLGKLLVTYLWLPLTFIPQFKAAPGSFVFNTLYCFICIGVPIQINLAVQFKNQLVKVLNRAYLVGKMNFFQWVLKNNAVKAQWTLATLVLLSFVSFRSILLSVAIMSLWGIQWIPSVWFRIQIKIFEMQNFYFSSLIYTLREPLFTITDSVTTLEKVADKQKLVNSGAKLQIYKICAHSNIMKMHLSKSQSKVVKKPLLKVSKLSKSD